MRPSEWPATLSSDPRGLRAVREDLLSRGLLAAVPSNCPVRPVIERSLRRCVADAVPTDRGELPHSDVSSMTLALRDAAAPVVERISSQPGGRRLEMQGLAGELGVCRVTLYRQARGREALLGKALWMLTEATLVSSARRWWSERLPGELRSPGTGRYVNAITSR